MKYLLISVLVFPVAAFAQNDSNADLRKLQDICGRHYHNVNKAAQWDAGFDGKNVGDVDCASVMRQEPSDLGAAKSLATGLGVGIKN